MERKQNIVPLKDLNLTSRFLFDEVPEELVEFLHYIENTTDEVAGRVKSEKIKRIHRRVCRVKMNEEVGVKYMQAWEEKYYEREEGREEGELLKLICQVCRKIEKGLGVPEIADMLEEDEGSIQRIYDAAVSCAPDYDSEMILEKTRRK